MKRRPLYCLAIILCHLIITPAKGQKRSTHEWLDEILNAGRERIEAVVEKYSLQEEFDSTRFLGFWSGKSWVIVSDRLSYYSYYSGNFDKDSLSTGTISHENIYLRNLFSLSSMDFDNYEVDPGRSWPYAYFVLYDATHESYIDFNSYLHGIKKAGINSHRQKKKLHLKNKKSQSNYIDIWFDIVVLWYIMFPDVFPKMV